MRFYKPSIRRNDMQEVLMSMADEQIGPGKRCELLKEAIKKYLNFKNIVFLRSPTTALFQALSALKINEGDKILLSCFTPSLYMRLLEESGINLIFADIDKDTALLDEAASDNTEKGIKAVFAYGALGHTPNMLAFKEKGLMTICDMTECIGCDVSVDSIDVAIISLEDDKMLTSAGGAALMSNSVDLGEPLREDTLTDLNAALCLKQLEAYETYLKKRLDISNIYTQAAESASIRVFSYCEKSNAFKFAILLENPSEVLKFIEKKKVPIRKAFAGTAYETLQAKDRFKNASCLYNRVYCLPLYYYMKTDEIELVRKVLSALP